MIDFENLIIALKSSWIRRLVFYKVKIEKNLSKANFGYTCMIIWLWKFQSIDFGKMYNNVGEQRLMSKKEIVIECLMNTYMYGIIQILKWTINQFSLFLLSKKRNSHKSETKWISEIESTQKQWRKIYSLPFQFTKNSKLLWLQYNNYWGSCQLIIIYIEYR